MWVSSQPKDVNVTVAGVSELVVGVIIIMMMNAVQLRSDAQWSPLECHYSPQSIFAQHGLLLP